MRRCRNTSLVAFTLVELVVVLGVIILVAALVLPGIARQQQRARRIQCVDNLKQLGLVIRTRAIDSGDGFFSQASTNRDGVVSRTPSREAFRYFQVMSNELGAPKLLICPADTRVPATDLGPGFSNTNLSYFVSLDAAEVYPQMFLFGDRNLTNGQGPQDGILVLTPNRAVGWTHELHNRQGNIAMADGSVQGLANTTLPGLVGGITNRLAMP